MSKLDHRPLYGPGGHRIIVAELLAVAVESRFTARRHVLWEGLCALLKRLWDLNLAGMDLWVDGSFLTEKPEPHDVDAVLWISIEHIDNSSDADYDGLMALQDRAAIRSRYGVDLYLAVEGDDEEAAYWREKLGSCHDGQSAKGYAIITL